MNTLSTTLGLAILPIALAVPGIAQDPSTPRNQDRDTQHQKSACNFANAEDLLGKAAVLQPAGDGHEDDAGTDGTQANQPEKIGTVADLLIEVVTGSASMFGIEHDGHVRAVPADRVRWDQEAGRWVVSMTKEQLLDTKIANDGDMTDLRAPKAAGGRDGEDAASRARVMEASVRMDAPRQIALSTLNEIPVRGSTGEIASSADVILETSSATVAFLGVALGGTLGVGAHEIAVPFPAVRVETVATGDASQGREHRLALRPGHPTLEQVPAAEDATALADQKLREKLYEAFGVEKPKFERDAKHADHADGSKKKSTYDGGGR